MPEWLPDLVLLEECGGVWGRYIDHVYSYFYRDFIEHTVKYENIRVNVRRYPYYDGKVKAFWHLVSDGDIEDQRCINLRRCERIRWPKPIIEMPEPDDIWIWQNDRKSEKRILLYIPEERYLVVLGIREGYFLLCSAYYVEHISRHKKLEKEYRAYTL